MAQRSKVIHSIKTALPWNFQVSLMRKDVVSLESPVNNEKYFPHQTYVSLFKDFAEAIESNDTEALVQSTEPLFLSKFGPILDEAHSML
jgi:hypothetical protein